MWHCGIILLIVMFIASALGGMIWGMIPAVFKAYWNTNETLFTLMLNYVAMQVVTYCIVFWENPKGSNTVGIINQATQAAGCRNCLDRNTAGMF